MFEQNKYEEAMELFQQAVHKSRGVQSLNNLAWMYFYEEENDDKALELIREVVKLNPSSYFPYNILGDIYMKQEKWTEANNHYKTMIERIKSGYVPGLEFETDFIGGCYLFGCKRHNHLEYEQ
ncbi:tetratricopeptide repeat family protein [Bacillus cereus ATCC 4342]|nr:tetratricopeptide repeat family protein [Bacillus cereus ATCC 4342]KFM88677.1 tetratricopeptide repeat family protein [Bacillus cereus ATCC 4342]